MLTHVALLRGINVGGSGLLPMKELAAICLAQGFADVRTYIQSGNVLFKSSLSESNIRSTLEPVLAARLNKPVDVMIRNAAEMGSILSRNPFPNENPAKVAVAFLHDSPAANAVTGIAAPGGEQIRAGSREIYILYPNGMGQSRLKLPSGLGAATIRNINTVAKLVALSEL